MDRAHDSNLWWRPERITIKATTRFSGQAGYSVRGSGYSSIHIFCITRDGAETIKGAYKNLKLSRDQVNKITDDVLRMGL